MKPNNLESERRWIRFQHTPDIEQAHIQTLTGCWRRIKNSSLITTTRSGTRGKQTLTLMTLSSSAWQELWSVTSATFPAWVTMKTFMTWDTCRPVSTAVFINSQFCGEKCKKSCEWQSAKWEANFKPSRSATPIGCHPSESPTSPPTSCDALRAAESLPRKCLSSSGRRGRNSPSKQSSRRPNVLWCRLPPPTATRRLQRFCVEWKWN